MKRVLLLDLDGPIVDVRPRYLALHRELIGSAGGEPLGDAQYWALKRARTPERAIFEQCGVAPERVVALERERLARIESPACLRLDRVWPFAPDTLDRLAATASLVLVTQRVAGEALEHALADLRLDGRFDRVLAGRGGSETRAKAARIRDSGCLHGAEAALVGDTEVDVASAHALGIPALWTRTGIRSDASIAPYAPDARLDDLRALEAWLAAEGWR